MKTPAENPSALSAPLASKPVARAAILPSADTGATSIAFVIGDTNVVDVKSRGKRGTL